MTPPRAGSRPRGQVPSLTRRALGGLAATLLCLAAFVPSAAQEATYVVDPDNPAASDANTGNEGAPFASLERALDVAEPGDRIVLIVGSDASVYDVQTTEGLQPTEDVEPREGEELRTGRPVIFDSAAPANSRPVGSIFPPNPPPTWGLTTRTLPMGKPNSRAM